MIHKDGIWWYQAPRPRRWHTCRPWTTGRDGAELVQRCACGAIRLGMSGPWMERNSRRKG